MADCMQPGETLWVWDGYPQPESDWVTVVASHWGRPVVDPPEPAPLTAAAFTTPESAVSYRARARPGSVAAEHRYLVRATFRGGVAFARVGDIQER